MGVYTCSPPGSAKQILNKYFLLALRLYICLFYVVIYRVGEKTHTHAQTDTPSGFAPEHVAPRCYICAACTSFFQSSSPPPVGQNLGEGVRRARARFSDTEISITAATAATTTTTTIILHGRRQITRGDMAVSLARAVAKKAPVRAERIYRFAGPVIRYSRTNVRDIN